MGERPKKLKSQKSQKNAKGPKSQKSQKNPLREIPGVGPRTAAVMEALGFQKPEDLRGQDPEALYLRECLLKGRQEDRCALYVWRAAVYFAEHPDPDPEKLKWWYWKDQPYPEEGAGNEFAQ